MANTELLLKTLKYIEEHPDQHDQFEWVNQCGTALCFGGWAVVLATGNRPDPSNPWFVDGFTGKYSTCSSGSTMDVGEYAEKILDLNPEQADRLFHPLGTLGEVRKTVSDIINGRL